MTRRAQRLYSGYAISPVGKYITRVHDVQWYQCLSLFIADPPGKPAVTNVGVLRENDFTNFTCISSGGFPPPTFMWKKGGMELPASLSQPMTLSDDRYGSKLELKLSFSDHRTDIICEATNILDSSKTSIKLDVQCKYIWFLPAEVTPRRRQSAELLTRQGRTVCHGLSRSWTRVYDPPKVIIAEQWLIYGDSLGKMWRRRWGDVVAETPSALCWWFLWRELRLWTSCIKQQTVH